ncbi:hypothetical protein A2755_03775 [Candidatus Wolfebacteria bacterium RIFCSPHIGHO2_01_FULL_48_22]|uniref:Valine--tRNA ligase n=2 Tax=Candidatus Wolfeibacteriota TaxID=1752735 RepID=A0A1F8DNS3_9BACT|nr:MAG: hypothetical protein A2755_03775 [Candidatus Wolfebacteria bacterium RIFCSPHIGHO2_01_FULL_48_22]OGM93460.1 MAG: hypothetical protein A2935_01125 [Candidatus Wolfebacteria bacterium RIFCSPLOWO2_01_FULL_47_17b]
MDSAFLKPYDHSKEKEVYAAWGKSGFFNPDNLPGDRKEPYTIMIAPPNITGSLHMGHALENTISDILIRYHRMKGYKTLWLPGTDHAGIATQNVVEKDLKKQGLSRHDLGREKFLEKIWEWKEKYGNVILDQLKSLGCSMDWGRTRFTMDEEYQKSVKAAFEHYHKKGLIYQGERVINWCVKDQTALSDLELEYEEEVSKLWYLKYPIKDSDTFVIVATTRPETMLGDTAVVVNPKDKRYKELVGKMIVLPIVDREIPVVADEHVDMEFGTGAVKVTPAHDMADSDIGERHNLPFLKVINEVGKIIQVNSDFDGLKIANARKKVVEEFKKLGFFEKEEDLTHNVAKCYRCGSTVEPMLSKQWFVKMKPLAEKTLAAIKRGDVRYHPDRWEAIAVDWLEHVRDWCISRQIWWGHRIPIEGSEDTFDTWFSSALWPFATLGWPSFAKASEGKPSDLEKFYPTTCMTSARDILHLWISRMIFSGLEFMDGVPFKDVHIHATIQTKDGKRMSKSLGTGIDPMTLIEKYGADATRFGLAWQAMGTQDIRWAEEHVQAGRKFANKLWNIARFVITQTGMTNFQYPISSQLANEDKEILKKLKQTKKSVEEQIEAYEFGQALHTLYDFVWHDFADVYIEYSKDKDSDDVKNILTHTLVEILKLTHPFMPFVTEAIYQKLPVKKAEFLMVEEW